MPISPHPTVWAAFFILASVSAGNGASNYATSFEAPTFSPGTVQGQDRWVSGAYTNASSNNPGTAAVISATNPSVGSQSLLLDGSKFALNDFGVWAGRALNFQSAIGQSSVLVQADVALFGPGNSSGAEYATFAAQGQQEFELNSSLFGRWIMSSDGLVSALVYNDFNHTFSTVFTTPITLGEYYILGIQIDFDQRTVGFLFNGLVVASSPYNPAILQDTLVAAPVELLGSSATSLLSYKAHFDNYVMAPAIPVPVPEPASAFLILSGSIFGLLLQRRLRK